MSIQGRNLSDNAAEYLDALEADDDSSIVTGLPGFSTVTSEIANVTSVIPQSSGQDSLLENLIIPLYGTIFFLSIVGNSLVLITLARNKRMRTVTNVYLLNLSDETWIFRDETLVCEIGREIVTRWGKAVTYTTFDEAVSDLLLGVFCMPFTLLGQILKNFVFGLMMCKLIPYFQAVSVSVGVWTLVAISLERYFAICRPLKSRRWQTQFHAYKMIAVVWTLSLTWNAPILVVSQLKSLSGGRHKCRENWPSVGTERAYNLFLDGTLLLIPLLLMSLAYSLIAIKLWRGLKLEIRQSSTCTRRRKCDSTNFRVESCCVSITNALEKYFLKLLLLGRTESNATFRGSNYNNNNDRDARTTMVFDSCGPTSRSRRGFSSSSRHFQGASQGVPSRNGELNCLSSREYSPAARVTVNRDIAFLFLPFQKRRVLTGKCHSTDLSQASRIQIRANGSGCLRRDAKDIANEDQQDLPCPLTRQHVIRSNYMGKSIEAKKKRSAAFLVSRKSWDLEQASEKTRCLAVHARPPEPTIAVIPEYTPRQCHAYLPSMYPGQKQHLYPRQVIRMLFVIVLEFFVCWAPLHVINTWYLFAPELVYSVVGSTGISLVQLLAYVSSCCNPITYCFMNRKFRQAFLGLFECHRCWRVGCRHSDIAMATTGHAGQVGNNSELSVNDSTVYLGKASLVARSGIVALQN
ncbi:Cholecystokinin receptor type A [Temnothorax longispinosus]|uniref:Gastrin/cholecystokinin type B receptor n=1 Tax=Temnothorax longispinosus TaxID=300112 RepID=A0A4S2KST2_9HYME|nr:Cholecystokinin receptor type A [Temnothorax longispinosus]